MSEREIGPIWEKHVVDRRPKSTPAQIDAALARAYAAKLQALISDETQVHDLALAEALGISAMMHGSATVKASSIAVAATHSRQRSSDYEQPKKRKAARK